MQSIDMLLDTSREFLHQIAADFLTGHSVDRMHDRAIKELDQLLRVTQFEMFSHGAIFRVGGRCVSSAASV